MKISYKKLQTFLIDKLPAPDVLVEALTFHAFEVEGIERVDDDTIIDVKVLPDRFCYAKSYEGIAREASTILGLEKKDGMVKFGDTSKKITLNVSQINEVLGSTISNQEVIDILKRMDIKVENSESGELVLSIPSDRLDLATWRDIPEEVGRIYGYDKIVPILSQNTAFRPQIEKTFYYSEKVKNILVNLGFSEVYTYSLVSSGDYEIEKPLASDKNHLRTNLTDSILKSLELNAKNAELLGLETIKIFEIGKVFQKAGEKLSVSIGVKGAKSESILTKVVGLLDKEFGGGFELLKIKPSINQNSVVVEFDFDTLINEFQVPSSYSDLNFQPATKNVYKKFSVFPFIVRDIAVFVPQSIESQTVWESVQKGIRVVVATSLLERYSLFDTFKKGDKVSYAFRIVFQSSEKTLTDEEVNKIMESIYTEIKVNNWEVR